MEYSWLVTEINNILVGLDLFSKVRKIQAIKAALNNQTLSVIRLDSWPTVTSKTSNKVATRFPI